MRRTSHSVVSAFTCVSVAILLASTADARSMSRGHGPVATRTSPAFMSRPATTHALSRGHVVTHVGPVARSVGFAGHASRHVRGQNFGAGHKFKSLDHGGYGSFGYGFAAPFVGLPFYDGYAGSNMAGKLKTLQQNQGYGHDGSARVHLSHPAQLARSADGGHSTFRYYATPQPAPLPRVQFVAVPTSKAKIATVYKRH